MATYDAHVLRSYTRRALGTFLAWIAPVAPIAAYLDATVLGVSGAEGLRAVVTVVPALVLLLGALYPYVLLRVLVGRALADRPGDAPGDRLARILRLPYRLAVFATYGAYTVGGLLFALWVCHHFDKGLTRVALGTSIGLCVAVVLAFPIGLSLERLFLPLALEEARRQPGVTPEGRGLFWPRQRWFLPFTFVASIAATLLMGTCMVAVKLMGVRDSLAADLRAEGAQRSLAHLEALSSSLSTELGFALLWVAGLVLVLPGLSTWMLARRQATGASAVHTSLEALAEGRATAPAWVSTDELGDLASGMGRVLEKLRRIPLTLQSSATRLSDAGHHLRAANVEQEQSLSRQAAALHQVQVSSAQLRQTSQLTAEQAEAVLRTAQQAESLGERGESAVVDSLEGLTAIQQSVDTMQERLVRLAESTTKIGAIADTVKSLADQSNLLAVNAAIEAVRSGEHGKGFGVVAREIRGLANQSIDATLRIRASLDEVVVGIRETAALGEQSTLQVASGLERMRVSGESLKELSRASRESAASARRIAAAVTEQHAGFAQISTTLAELSHIMDTTLTRLSSTQQAAGTLDTVSQQVVEMARQFDVH